MTVAVKYDELIQSTPKAYLIRNGDHVTWVPKVHSSIKRGVIHVADWLYPNLIWVPNYEDIDYVADEDETLSIKEKCGLI